MSTPGVGHVTVACQPGPGAWVGVRDTGSDHRALVLYLDPVSLMVMVPPFPGGQFALARWCRELGRAAQRLATEMDPEGLVAEHDPDPGRPAGGLDR